MAAVWVMICGAYSSGAGTEAEREANLARLNEAALAVLHRGHVPVVGVNLALPIARLASAAEDVVLPVSLALTERCDACVRLEGASAGADEEVKRFVARGLPVYGSVEELPPA